MTHRPGSIVCHVLLGLMMLACNGAPAIPTPSDGMQVTISGVFDGDTVELADGRRLRYVGINAPERGQPFYEEATEANRRLVEGRSAWMVLDTQPTDRFGRILAYVWVNGSFVNLELVRRGYANAYTEPPNVRYSQELIAAEREAREAGIGLWVPAGVRLKIVEIHFDAPGPDSQNPNGEWVELLNEGTQPVDLKGFTLKDQANHIFTFPAVNVGPGESLRVYSGRGSDSARALFWGLSGESVWNNDGDVAYLRDAQGQLVDSRGYQADQ